MPDRKKYLINQFDLQSRLFHNVTAGIPEAYAGMPMNRHTNHVAWLAGHTVSTRYMLANTLGIQAQEPFPELFRDGKGMDRSAEYPPMRELTKDWDPISAAVKGALNALDDQGLDGKAPMGDTLGDYVSFLMHHEAYTLGQLGIFRRFHGLEPMKYE